MSEMVFTSDMTHAHFITDTADGAECTCGRSWSVWTSKRRSGWSAGTDFLPTLNLLQSTARRHAKAQNDKEAAAR